jgi:hypothetical protein
MNCIIDTAKALEFEQIVQHIKILQICSEENNEILDDSHENVTQRRD